MRLRFVAVLSFLVLVCIGVSAASASEPIAFTRSHPKGYPSLLLSWGEEYHGVFNIGPEVERMPLTEDWIGAKIRKIADDEVKFYLGQLRYFSYLNNICGGTQCTITANIRAYVPMRDRKDDDSLIVRLTLNGSAGFMETYMYAGKDGGWHVLSRGENSWIGNCDSPEVLSFKGISDAALYLVWKDAYRTR